VDGQHSGTVSQLSGSIFIWTDVRIGRRSETKLRCKLQDKQPESPPRSLNSEGIDIRLDSNPDICPGSKPGLL
jgi:hypothetical protein